MEFQEKMVLRFTDLLYSQTFQQMWNNIENNRYFDAYYI